MEQVTTEQREEIVKTSTERLILRLLRAGYEEDKVLSFDRGQLMEVYAQYLLSPPSVEPLGAVGGVVGRMSDEERELRERELKLRELELEREKKRDQKDREEREKTVKYENWN